MITIANDQKGVGRKRPSQFYKKFPIVLGGHSLPANVFVHVRPVAEIMPIGCEFGAELLVPRKVIGHRINVEEQWLGTLFALDQVDGLVEIKSIGLEIACAEI